MPRFNHGLNMVIRRQPRIPWTVQYDEVVLVLEGSFTVRTDDGVLNGSAMDSIWLPAGTKLTYKAEEALLFYAIHPANWATNV